MAAEILNKIIRTWKKCYLKIGICIAFFFSNIDLTNCGAEIYTSQSFELIRSSSYPHFVMFYAPWCGHCKRVQTLWDKYAEESHQTKKLKVAKVDCTEATPLCSHENIKAYPTFRLFNKKQKFTYKGNRNIVGFGQFVKNNIPDTIKFSSPFTSDNVINMADLPDDDETPIKAKVLTMENFQKEVEQDLTFVDFYAPWCPHCVQFEPTWNELATKFKHNSQITIAKVDCTSDPELCRSQDITAYPSLKLFQNGHMIAHYKQTRDLNHLTEFVEMSLDQAGIIEEEAFERDNEHVLPSDDMLVENIDASSFQENVKNAPYLVYFHNAWFQTSHEHLDLFSAVSTDLKDMHVNIRLAIMDCNLNRDYCGSLKITSFPQIRYFNSEADFKIYHGPLTVAHVIGYLAELSKSQNEQSKEEL